MWRWIAALYAAMLAAHHGYRWAAGDAAREAGRTIPRLARALIYPAIAFGYVLDVAWNCTIGSALFLEPPFAGGTGHV